jgi:hypothetical protein
MTRHFSEADLLETYYTQPGESMPVMMHLANCADCAARYDRLDRKLREAAACHTDKPESFWAQQRQTIMQCVSASRQKRASRVPLTAAAAAVLALVLGGVMFSQREETPAAPVATPVAVEETVPSDPWESEQLQEYEAVVEWESWIGNESEGTS